MSIKIRFVTKGKSLKTVIKDAKMLELKTKKELNKLGVITRDKMIEIINQNSKQPASPKGLRKSIKLDFFPKGGWGLGKISDLPAWWTSFNWGGNWIIRAKNVNFLKFKGKDGQWVYRKSVRHIQSPVNYIEKTVFYFRNGIKNIMSKIRGKK